MKDFKDSNEDKLLYKTIDKLEKRDKGRFWFTVLIISSVVLAITTLLSLGYNLNQQRERDAQQLKTERLEAELDKLKAEKELETMAIEVFEVVANQEATDFEENPSPDQKKALKRSLERVAKRADGIISKTRQGRSFKDTLFVWSHVGLIIREEAKADADITWGFPFGTPVQNISGEELESEVFEIPTFFGKSKFTLSGGYLEVERDTIEGFGYSGLLSPLPVFISAKSIEEYVSFASSNVFLLERYGLTMQKEPGPKDVTILETQNLSMQQVFLLARNLYEIDQKVKDGAKATKLVQLDNRWSVTVGDVSITVEKVDGGVNARVEIG